jgi:RNA-binding protein NOB1
MPSRGYSSLECHSCTDETKTCPLEVTDSPTEEAGSAIDIPPETPADPVNSPGCIEEDPKLEALAARFEQTALDEAITRNTTNTSASDEEHSSEPPSTPPPIYDDPSPSDDGEGEWITPSNVGIYKSRALDLLPQDAKKTGKLANAKVQVGCMTADFAMQNVLLHMGLDLVGVEGKKITRIKNWVLRCHACFK